MLAVLIAGAAAGILAAPHCALMCGPLTAHVTHGRAAGSAQYQISRGLSYALAGALVGAIGKPVIRRLWDSEVTTALSWALAMLMAVAAYKAWPRSRENTKDREPALVQIKARGASQKASRIQRLLRSLPKQPALFGGLSVLIPCGALWGGLVLAASSGSPAAGALAMATFSLTSGTGLLASSFLSRRLRARSSHHRVLALVFAIGALMLVLRPISIGPATASTSNGSDQDAPLHCPLHPGGM